ncbi:family 43 glycosylhydrolase [Actinomarinicola tropica]|uniref:Family 43 glycosylhydrolase n=1 Tax=Actinomarinicola tropica TaxID=2789776 RepID=A0A5Q2RFQ9_9ACTN|nr:glycoside hydrolase family 43 protein [Actinomarinicola tropica]QGG94484.1 family 43 glycosylhydrolase [Actinomarinicola tropica]
MPRRRSPRLLVAAVATVVSLFSPQVASAVPPALDWDVADPALVADGDVLRLYSTNVAAWGALLNVPSYRSTDGGTTWEQTGDVLPELGGWAVPGATWAPDVHRFGATWVLYYTARVADAGTLQCIGVATAATPTGPFVDERGHPIACQGHLGGSIDPSVFVDADGVPWLLYKSDENALGLRSSRLWSRQLTADGTDVVGPEHELLGRDRLWEGHLVEQPEMVAAAGRAWLLYSANDWESGTYGVGFATCEGPTWPCDKRTVGGPWLSRTDHAAGIGGASVAALPDGRAGDPRLPRVGAGPDVLRQRRPPGAPRRAGDVHGGRTDDPRPRVRRVVVAPGLRRRAGRRVLRRAGALARGRGGHHRRRRERPLRPRGLGHPGRDGHVPLAPRGRSCERGAALRRRGPRRVLRHGGALAGR